MTFEEAKAILKLAKISCVYKHGAFAIALDMAIKAIETVEEFETAQIITSGRLNGRTYAYKCGLEDGKRKALNQELCKDAKDKAFNNAMFIRGLYNGLRMCRPDYNADDYRWIIGKAVWNDFVPQTQKYRLLPMLEDTATLYGIKVEVENINRYCIKLYENITNKIDVEKDKNENRGEVIKMLTKLKEQAKENILLSDTLIEDVKLDSFNFVINKAIELIKGGEK